MVYKYILLLSLLILDISILGNGDITTKKGLVNSSITSIFIFGDSTVDPGNNDYLKTLFKGNFPPYGVDFPGENPTGRFTNGRLPTDFIASYIGIKEYIPAYLDPDLKLKDLITGVSFASAGTGYDPLTALKTGLIDRGARRIGVVGLPPVGCLPIVVTLHSSLHQPRTCVGSLSSIARDYNKFLQNQLISMQSLQPNSFIVYGDIFTPLNDQFTHPHKYGFDVADRGCCGTGLIEGAIACNSLIPICSDRSKYIFWDAIHPTEKSYYYLFEALRPAIDSVIQHSK